MKRIYLVVIALISAIQLSVSARSTDELVLRFSEPARQWEEALPLGNGRIGAMVYGGVEKEMLCLNEVTLWSGVPKEGKYNPDARKHLPALRKALREDRFEDANNLSKKMQGDYSQSYMPLGNMLLQQYYAGEKAEVRGYSRTLDIEESLANVDYKVNGVNYHRELFASYPDNVLVMRISGDAAGSVNFDLGLECQLTNAVKSSGNRIEMTGNAPYNADPVYYNPGDREPIVEKGPDGLTGMRFIQIAEVQTDGNCVAKDGKLQVRNAKEATIIFTAATSFNGPYKHPITDGVDEKAKAEKTIKDALLKT